MSAACEQLHQVRASTDQKQGRKHWHAATLMALEERCRHIERLPNEKRLTAAAELLVDLFGLAEDLSATCWRIRGLLGVRSRPEEDDTRQFLTARSGALGGRHAG